MIVYVYYSLRNIIDLLEFLFLCKKYTLYICNI